MPSRINGIGTWYWGRNNIITRNITCEFCGNPAQLTSYDTTLYFTVLFLPIIPLQRKRVLNQCSRCRRHRVIPLKKWEEQKTTALVDALNAWQTDRSNTEKARQAINVTVGYQDRHAFEDLAPSITQAFARDADMQMFLATGYDHFNQPAGAESAYHSAVAVRNDPSTRRAYASFLMRQLRPDEAAPLLQDILATRDRTGAPLLLIEAQACQAVGNHAAASALLEETSTAFPDLLSTPDFQRIAAISSKYRGSNKRVATANLDPAQRGGAKNASWFHRNGAAVVICTILGAVAAWYFIDAATSANHQVFVVNGTSRPYQAVIDGASHGVPAKSFLTLDLTEGHHTVKVPDHPEIDPAEIDIQTSFWGRPFNHRTFVINPDRTALIYERDVVYTTKNSTASNVDEKPPRFYVGQSLYNFKKPDDAFTEPPSTVDLSSDSSIVHRQALDQLSKMSITGMYELVYRQIGASAAAEWAKRAGEIADDQSFEAMQLIGMVGQQMKPAEMIAYLRPRLIDRPVRVLWHRIYQSEMEKLHPDYDLTADYRVLLAKNPDDPALIYLFGRTLGDRPASRKLYEQAAGANPPCAYASYALSYDDMYNLHFEQAQSHIEDARRSNPNNPQFILAELQSLEALGRLDAAIELVRSQQKHDGRDISYVDDEIRLLAAKGDAAAANHRVDSYCNELATLHEDKETIDIVRNNLQAMLAYARGDMPAFKAAIKQVKGDEAAIELAIVNGDYAAAEMAINASRKDDLQANLTLSALANANGSKAIADRAWQNVLAQLAAGDKSDRKLAAALASPNPAGDTLDCHDVGPDERPVLLLCIAQRFPAIRQASLASAEKLNFRTAFPHREVSQAVEKLQ